MNNMWRNPLISDSYEPGSTFKIVTATAALEEGKVEEIRSLIEGKNFAALNDLLEPYAGQGACRALRRLSRLFGGAEVLDEAEELAGGSAALVYLRQLYTALSKAGYGEHIRFDLGLVHQIDYYTGVVFRGYVEGAGDAVLSGGRYDKLVETFGRPAPATGFAVDVDAVAGCLPEVPAAHLETLVHYGADDLARALAAVDAGTPGTVELSPCIDVEETIALAKEKGAHAVLVLENGSERRVEL